MKARLLPLLLLFLIGGCTAAELPFSWQKSAEATPSSDWVQVSSPHFDVAATTGEKTARTLAQELELYRALVFEVLDAPDTKLPIPVRVHAFNRARQISGAVGPGALAEFPPSMREYQFGVVGNFKGLENLEFALHQYTHLLLYNDFELDYPLWLREGIAVFLSTARNNGSEFEIGGNPDDVRLTSINLDSFPIERLLRTERYGDLSEAELTYFTVVSTALVRYLMTINEQGGYSHSEFARYRDLVDEGKTVASAFETVFGESPKRIGEKLTELIDQKIWPVKRFPVASLNINASQFPATKLSAAETHTRLASYTLSRFDLESALWHTETALGLDPENARAHVFRGALYQTDQRWKEAETHFRRALELDPSNALNHLDWAECLHAKAVVQYDEPRRVALFDQARAAYQKSLALDPNHPETLAKLGEAIIEGRGDPRSANVLIEKAYTIHPGSWKILQRLARARLAVGRDAEARALLWQSSERLHKRWTEEQVNNVIRGLAAL